MKYRVFAAIALLSISFAGPAAWAGTVVTNQDRNLVIRVQDAIVDGDRTKIAFDTTPDITQAHAAEACAANVYVIDATPGLPASRPLLTTENFCGRSAMLVRLLTNGDVVVIAGDRVERWTPGRGRAADWDLGDASELADRFAEINDGTTPIDITRGGDVIVAKTLPRTRNDTSSPSLLVLAYSTDGSLRWQRELGAPGVMLGAMDVRAAVDGGVWLHAVAQPLGAASLPSADAPPGMIVMRENRLYRLSASGTPVGEVALASTTMPDPSAPAPSADNIADIQAFLQRSLAAQEPASTAGYTEGEVVIRPRDGGVELLMGRSARNARLLRLDDVGRVILDVALTESMQGQGLSSWQDFAIADNDLLLYGVTSTPANRLPQGYLSTIDLATMRATTRLAPLNAAGLEAARAARDSEVRLLQDNPAQTAELLTELAGEPLVVSRIQVAGRPALQLNVIDAESESLTPTRSERATAATSRASAPAATPNEFASQIAAAMAQAQQAMAASGALIVTVNPQLQARAVFAHPGGERVDLVVLRKRTAAELLRRTFADGVVDDTVDLSAVGLPLDELAIVYMDTSNQIIGNPALMPVGD